MSYILGAQMMIPQSQHVLDKTVSQAEELAKPAGHAQRHTLLHVGTPLMSFSMGEVSARGPFFTCSPSAASVASRHCDLQSDEHWYGALIITQWLIHSLQSCRPRDTPVAKYTPADRSETSVR